MISCLTSRTRRDLIIAAHQSLTYEWWEKALPNFDAYISPVVLAEINRGDAQAAADRLTAVRLLPVLPIIPEVERLATLYFESIQLPEKARADSYHLAVATAHAMDYLVSWNCSHIVNGRVRRAIEEINFGQDIKTPICCTPEELMEA